ncbi:MAG TPA: cytochrome d ubiquinol oxidase subunit II [Burkholderiales bacterium]|jgi:cytochrome d ubiquinol oxidase subunit II|nr:cytochrome d ubiquinol oxidase subunit II [Burkholderiales bacterium]
MQLDLPFVFMVLMGLAILAYVILDGFDLGVGILLPLASREEQDLMVASIGPFWDANETWLVLGVGILLVAFPHAHGIILSSLYLPVAVMLIGLILRGVAFEFRVKASGWHQEAWNRLFFLGSLGAALAQGVMLAGVVTGFKQGALATAFGLLVGVGLAGGYALLGATWLTIKTEGDLQAKSLAWGRAAVLLTAAGVAAISLATPFANTGIMHKWFAWPRILWLAPLPILSAAAIAGIWIWNGRLQRAASKREWLPFVLAVWIFVFAFAGLAYSLYPYLVVDRMTIWQAAAAPSSLKFVLVGTVIVLPVIVFYTVFSYRVFWGKARNLTYGA